MFQIGDAVVHPVSGAGIITAVQKFGNQQAAQRYYKIDIVGKTKTVIMVPIEQAEDLGLRSAISKPNLQRVWQVLRDEPVVLPAKHKTRYKVLQDKLATQEPMKIAEVLRDLEWRRLQEERLNVPGKRIYDKAMKFLAGEIALCEEIQVQAASDKIRTLLNENLTTRVIS